MSEDNFFAMPAGSGDEADIAYDNAEPVGDAPILLGGPPDDAAYVGDVTEDAAAAQPSSNDEPVLMMPTDEAPPEEGQEPSPMQKWNAEWLETLKTRKEEENARKAELVEAARVDMENFHTEREQKRETKMAANRSDEQEKLEAIEADLENDNSWQRVCKMVELSHDNKADAEDVKRMRDIMILLKNEPTRATALIS